MTNLIDPKQPGVTDLSLSWWFKGLLVFLVLAVFLSIPWHINHKRTYLENRLSSLSADIKSTEVKIEKCDNKKTESQDIECNNIRQNEREIKQTIAADRLELSQFRSQYYAMVVWLPVFIAAGFILMSQYVGLATLITIINTLVLALSPGLDPYQSNHSINGLSSTYFAPTLIFLTLLAYLTHGYSLYLVRDKPLQKSKHPPDKT